MFEKSIFVSDPPDERQHTDQVYDQCPATLDALIQVFGDVVENAWRSGGPVDLKNAFSFDAGHDIFMLLSNGKIVTLGSSEWASFGS